MSHAESAESGSKSGCPPPLEPWMERLLQKRFDSRIETPLSFVPLFSHFTSFTWFANRLEGFTRWHSLEPSCLLIMRHIKHQGFLGSWDSSSKIWQQLRSWIFEVLKMSWKHLIVILDLGFWDLWSQYILSLRTLVALGSVYLVLPKVLRLKFPQRILGASFKTNELDLYSSDYIHLHRCH